MNGMVIKRTKNSKQTKTKRAQQARLPGTTNAIKELDDLSHEYAEARDDRMKHLGREVDLKVRLKDAMHKHKRKTYKYEDVNTELVPGEETVKVKISKKKDASKEPE